MIVDTSAILAVAADEIEGPRVASVLASASPLRMSAGTRLELAAVLVRRASPIIERRVQRLLDAAGVEFVPFDAQQVEVAARAYRDFGRGTGHPAGLDFGDCFAYALAAVLDEPLLFVGDDFARTDVRSALA